MQRAAAYVNAVPPVDRTSCYNTTRADPTHPDYHPVDQLQKQLYSGQPGQPYNNLYEDASYAVHTNGVRSVLDIPVAARQARAGEIFHFRPLSFADEAATHQQQPPPLRFDTVSDRLSHQHNDEVEQHHLSWFARVPTPLAKAVRDARATTRQIFRDTAPLLDTEFEQELLRLRLSVTQQVQYSTLQQLELSITNIEALTGALHESRDSESKLRAKVAVLEGALALAQTRVE